MLYTGKYKFLSRWLISYLHYVGSLRMTPSHLISNFQWFSLVNCITIVVFPYRSTVWLSLLNSICKIVKFLMRFNIGICFITRNVNIMLTLKMKRFCFLLTPLHHTFRLPLADGESGNNLSGMANWSNCYTKSTAVCYSSFVTQKLQYFIIWDKIQSLQKC